LNEVIWSGLTPIKMKVSPTGSAFVWIVLEKGRRSVSQIIGEDYISRVGEYQGYSTPTHDGWIRESQYIEVRDGTRLAIDVFRPTKDGIVEENPVPVVWTAKRYLRSSMQNGVLTRSLLQSEGLMDRPAARTLISHGYALAAADMRGTGASFGKRSELSDPFDSLDGHDVTEWLAAQPWCNQSVGMFGVSYEGRLQLNAASAQPPHLKAIMPEVSPFDWYELIFRGGIRNKRMADIGEHFRSCDLDTSVAPVDGDEGGVLATEARKEHEVGNDYSSTTGVVPFRDSFDDSGTQVWKERSGEALLPGIVASGVATYHTTGWFAPVGRDQLLWFSNLARSKTGAKHRILVGPWPAGGIAGATAADLEMWAVETLRFMDYWLKDIDNGIMNEPAVVYATSESSSDREVHHWNYAASWPHPDAVSTDYAFAAGPSGSIRSVNDGRLVAANTTSEATGVTDTLVTDDTISAPVGDMRVGGPNGTSFRSYDERCLTYTTEPLAREVNVTGSPVVSLLASIDGSDGDFVFQLEDVDEQGDSTFVSYGRIRASMRAIKPAPFYNFDAPWQSLNESDILDCAGEMNLVTDLQPTSYRFRAGHRIRVSLAGSDAVDLVAPDTSEPTTLRIHLQRPQLSKITLPILVDGEL
jgi:uncharacterized protein